MYETITTWLAAPAPSLPGQYAHYVYLLAAAYLAFEAALKKWPTLLANSPLEFAANIVRRIPAVGVVVAPWTSPQPDPDKPVPLEQPKSSALLVLVLCGMCVSGCAAGYAAGTITVTTIAEGGKIYGAAANKAEAEISAGAVAACKAQPTRAAFLGCAGAYAEPRRKPYDVADKAFEDYQKAAQLGAAIPPGTLQALADKVIAALAAVGINVIPGGK
jgi:hypothetical protein